MSAQGSLFKMMTTFSSYRSLLSRPNLLICQQNASVRSLAKDKLKQLNIPEAPKKPLNPYFRFMVEYRLERKKTNPGGTTVEIAKECAEAWKTVDEQVKERYVQEFKAAEAEYIQKRLEYSKKLSPEQKAVLEEVTKETRELKHVKDFKKTRKDLGLPKRPVGSYMYFTRDKCKELNKTPFQITDIIKKEWHEMTPEMKQKYTDMHLDDKKRYDIEMEAWEEKMIQLGKMDMIRKSSIEKLDKDVLKKDAVKKDVVK